MTFSALQMSCSQNRTTFQPLFRSRVVSRLSRRLFPSSWSANRNGSTRADGDVSGIRAEATIDEDCDLRLLEGEIGLT